MIFQHGGVDLYYEDYGQGPAIVFIHGLGENGDTWKHQLAYFGEAFRVVAMDLRGHGRSGDGREEITIRLFAEDVLALLSKLGIEKAHFVGHSMGGLISQEIAAHYRGRVLTMTLSDAAGYYPPPVGTEGLQDRLEKIDGLPMEQFAEMIAEGACCQDTPLEIKQQLRDIFSANRKQPYRQATISTLQSDYRPYHETMDVPTFIMVGKFDKTTPLTYAQYLNFVIKNSKLQIIQGAAHMSKLENPLDYNRAVLEFLAPYELDGVKRLLAAQTR